MKEEGQKKKKMFFWPSKDRSVSAVTLGEALGIAGGWPGSEAFGPMRESLTLCQEGEKAASTGALPAPSPRLPEHIQLFRSLAFDDRNV